MTESKRVVETERSCTRRCTMAGFNATWRHSRKYPGYNSRPCSKNTLQHQVTIALVSPTGMNVRAQEIASALPSDLDSLPRLRGFRLRGIAMTRLETFIDATLAFAITMLVIAAQQIPDDIETLLAAFKNVPAFVASVANKWKFMVVATAIARRPESRVPAAHYNHGPD